MTRLRPVQPADHSAIAALTTQAFNQAFPNGPGSEARITEDVRAEGAAWIELVAEIDGEIVGHILFSRMTCDPPRKVAGLGPVSVRPDKQRNGLGGALCAEGLARCRADGAVAAVVLGHPGYYPRFGFTAAAATPLSSPYAGSPAFMAMALQPGGLEGLRIVSYAAAFG